MKIAQQSLTDAIFVDNKVCCLLIGTVEEVRRDERRTRWHGNAGASGGVVLSLLPGRSSSWVRCRLFLRNIGTLDKRGAHALLAHVCKCIMADNETLLMA